MQQTNDKRWASNAVAFHSIAGWFLAAHGFAITNDPGLVGMHGGSAACYRCKRGLALWVVFEPYDGAGAAMSCGREWTPKGAASFLSNHYAKLAARFGLDLPLIYPIASGEQPAIVAEKILADLKRSLPIVVAKVSMEDLVAIENEEPIGAALCISRGFGAGAAANVEISEFSGVEGFP
jgi:hypothetical protein